MEIYFFGSVCDNFCYRKDWIKYFLVFKKLSWQLTFVGKLSNSGRLIINMEAVG
ncbi:MAG: hypothetical protein DF168_00850 [Candidatus Moanabacter tarae]|uniref:Uncharacterized protein n=1 Tax=Candidatus Moanibacter tarae TaxID=2200854 RepID=A0A2Z4AHV5_9BACT|nr:MAG: hypothetical protein DF168_00850 [Candidatus Moanabacter tarae]